MSTATFAPSALSMPAPPSVVADPPIPSAMSLIPASRTARSRSPVPCVPARIASRAPGLMSDSPDARAISTNAAAPSLRHSQSARIGRSSGSRASAVRRIQPPAASMATSVPSPPSASGARRTSSAGRARSQPAWSARATSRLVRDPLNESGAMSTRSGLGPANPPATISRPRRRRCRRDAGAPRTPECGSSAAARGRQAP